MNAILLSFMTQETRRFLLVSENPNGRYPETGLHQSYYCVAIHKTFFFLFWFDIIGSLSEENASLSNIVIKLGRSASKFFSLQNSLFSRRRMASTSHGGGGGGGSGRAAARLKNAASAFCSDTQPIIADIRKTVLMMKEIAVQLEKDNHPDKVKELEDAVIELVGLSEISVQFSSAVQAFANRYQPGEEYTNFNKIFEDELSNFKANQSSNLSRNPLVHQFKEAVWNVHHAGQPMPGEEQEDVIMTSTQSNILNITCPLTGKPVIELEEPVRSMECRHIYEKKIIMQYLKANGQCPISGCPKMLQADKLVQDPLLLIEIEEMRKMNKETHVEDYTMLNEDSD